MLAGLVHYLPATDLMDVAEAKFSATAASLIHESGVCVPLGGDLTQPMHLPPSRWIVMRKGDLYKGNAVKVLHWLVPAAGYEVDPNTHQVVSVDSGDMIRVLSGQVCGNDESLKRPLSAKGHVAIIIVWSVHVDQTRPGCVASAPAAMLAEPSISLR